MLAVLKALGDETRFSMYRELASSTHPLSRARARRPARHPRQHRAPPPRAPARGRSRRRRSRPPRHGRPPAARLLAGAGRARASGSTRRATRCSPGCSAALAERVGADADEADRDRPALGRRGRPPHPLALVRQGARRPSSNGSDSTRWPKTTTARSSIAFLHCPFRELAEAYPELVCNLHRGICEGVVKSVGGGSVDDFATLYDHDPCRVTVAVGYPEDA